MGRISRLSLSGAALAVGALLIFATTACNEHPVRLIDQGGDTTHIIEGDVGDADEIDLLWVIDNSGSMCRSQEILRNGIEEFIDILGEVNLDFHLAVTTTHMWEDEFLDGSPNFANRAIVAQPGHLQATPQPLPGFDDLCIMGVYDTDDPAVQDDEVLPGTPDARYLDPLIANIEAAVACTEDPDDYDDLLNLDEDEIRCAAASSFTCDVDHNRLVMDYDSDYCTCPSGEAADDYPNCIDCSNYDVETIEDVFPDPDDFRDIPLVLRSEDYRDDQGRLQIGDLRDDFSCMSLVGTRGSGFEQGLAAAVKAVSPEMTGGQFDDLDEARQARDQYPNAGFLRAEAETGIIFVGDENDCSYDRYRTDSQCDSEGEGYVYNEQVDGCILAEEVMLGGAEDSDCGVHRCTIEEKKGDDGLLISTDELADQFIRNIAASRGFYDPDDDEDELDAQLYEAIRHTILPASIHGEFQHFDDIEDVTGEPIPDYCDDEERDWVDEEDPYGANYSWVVPPSCRGALGVGWSGHRFEEFLRNFDTFFPVADPDFPDDPLPGEICQDFTEILEDLADFFASEGVGCVEDVYRCHGTDDESCPLHPSTGEEGQCTPYPGQDAGDDDTRYFCDTGIEVRLRVPDDAPGEMSAAERLENSDYCLEDTIDSRDYPGTCVVDEDRYFWTSCGDQENAMLLAWEEDTVEQDLDGLAVLIRYTVLSEADEDEDDEDDDNGDGDDDDNGDGDD